MSQLSDRSPSAYESLGLRLAAPAVGGQGVDTISGRNEHQWRAIAYFLCGLKVVAPHRGDVDESGQAQRRTLPARAPR